MPEFRGLEAFYWVARLRSFRRAAERLHLTQSAVSQRLAALEARLGARLIERGARAVVPTPAGRRALERAEQLLRLRAELLGSVAGPEALSGTLRLGVSETIVHTWLARFVERAHARFPRVEIDIEVDVSPRLRQGLAAGELDLAFLLGPLGEPRVLERELCRYPLAFVRSPRLPLAGGGDGVGDGVGEDGTVPLDALLRVPVITYPRTTAPYAQVEQLLRRPELPPPRIFGNSSLSTIVRMTLDRIGVSVIPPAVIRRELAYDHLRLVPTALRLPDLVFTAAHADAPDSPTAAALSALAVEVAAESGAEGGDKGF